MKLSIYVPAYNEEKWILKCLESIPIRDDIEVIVVDDGSTDRTFEIAKEFMDTHRLDMRIVSCTMNQGISYANNIGIDSCKGEYFYLVDADDYLYTEEFEKVIDELDGTDVVYIKAKQNNGTIMSPSESNHNLCAGWFKVIRTEFCKGIRRAVNCYGGDWDMWLEILNKPHTFKYTDHVCYHYNYPRVNSVTWLREHGKM